jgi:hypothetical protein
MAIEDRSTGWRIAQSWYVLLTLPIFTAFMAFVYIGIRGRQAKWFAWAAVYLGAILFLFGQPSVTGADGQQTYADWVGFAILGVWITSIVHAFRTRREFLAILDAQDPQAPPAYARHTHDPFATLRDEPRAQPAAAGDFAVFERPAARTPAAAAPVEPPPIPVTPPTVPVAPPPVPSWPAASPPPPPVAAPPPPPAPSASEPPPPFSGPAPFGGRNPFDDDADRPAPPAPPPPPRRPGGRQVDY